MSQVFKLKGREATVVGAPLVIVLTNVSLPNETQLICVSGDPIQIEGSPGQVFGLPVTPWTLDPTQSFNFNEQQYELITITIPVGTKYRIITNN